MIILDYWWQLALIGIAIYLLSNINYAIIFTKRFARQDIRACGSGNPGTTNVVRSFGYKLGALTFICDMTKGIVAAVVGKYLIEALFGSFELAVFASYFMLFCAVCGHIFPVFLKFKGGKGVATSLGFFLIIHFWFTICALVVGVIIILICDKISVFSLLHLTGQLIYTICIVISNELITSSVAIASITAVALVWIIIVIKHRQNIMRLIEGKENNSNLRCLIIKPKENAKEE
ncbi:MAG: glycerol-3-phosphate 1-O-acyltransferase PlsY [Clostridia bacterium]